MGCLSSARQFYIARGPRGSGSGRGAMTRMFSHLCDAGPVAGVVAMRRRGRPTRGRRV